MQDTIKELREEMQSISFAAYEASADRHKQERKHLIIGFVSIIIVLIIALVGTNLAWIIYDKSMETVTETTETIETITYEDIEQSAEGSGTNVIGGDVNG
jgi:hypothetical protein